MKRATHERVLAVLERARARGLSPMAVGWLELAANKLASDEGWRGTSALGHAHEAYNNLRLGLEPEAEALLCPLAAELVSLARAEQSRAAAEVRLERQLAFYEAAQRPEGGAT